MNQMTLLDMKKNNTPTEFARQLREMGDIFWWAPGNFWVITSHQNAKQVLTSQDFSCDRTPFFLTRMPDLNLELVQDFFAVISKMMVMSDAPSHTSRRRICYDGFTNQTLDQLEPLIQKTINRQIDLCQKKSAIEFVNDFAKLIPSITLAEFFSIREEDRENFYLWSNNMTQFFGGASEYQDVDGIKVNQSAKNLQQYFINLVNERENSIENDFLSILIKNKEAFGLTDDEIISQAIMMLVAGQITTTDQMCNNLFTLLSDSVAKNELLKSPSIIDTALDELNRLDPAVTFIFRVTKRDTKIGSQSINEGDVIFISTHAVNRDPLYFEQPDRCILTRQNNKEISYGYGSHYCLGAKLAKREMNLCLSALMRCFPNLEMDANNIPTRKHHSLAFSGFETFPLQF